MVLCSLIQLYSKPCHPSYKTRPLVQALFPSRQFEELPLTTHICHGSRCSSLLKGATHPARKQEMCRLRRTMTLEHHLRMQLWIQKKREKIYCRRQRPYLKTCRAKMMLRTSHPTMWSPQNHLLKQATHPRKREGSTASSTTK